MITRDFLLRQIHQLTQAIALVLFNKRAGRDAEAQHVLAEALSEATGIGLRTLQDLEPAELRALCSSGGSFSAEKAVALADLLREGASADLRRRALWLYEAALEAGGAVPFDLYDRMAALRADLPA